MRQTKNNWKRLMQIAALAAAVGAVPLKLRAGDSPNMVTWSISGSTAMRNFTISEGMTTLEADSPTLTLSNGTYVPGTNGIELAPSSFTGAAIAGTFGASASGAGVRIEWHEQGSVEGVLEMVNDQVGYDGDINGIPLIDPVTRNPSGGNPIRLNRNSFVTTGTIGGFTINGSGYNTYDAAQYNFTTGQNLQGGQNRVQMAISDVRAVQAFSKTLGATPAPNTPVWGLRPGETGYGKGNPLLTSSVLSGLGVANSRQQFVDDDAMNMKTTRIDPSTGTFYTAGVWNTAGIDNLVSKTVAITATVMAANPGTGLTQLNKTDAQWLQAAGRLQNGADFNVSQRDVGSGTRNVFALNTGIDPTWAVGENDDGNGNAGNPIGTANEQASIGSKLRFSGKTAGGGQLRPAIANNRMGLGPLGMSDAIGNVKNNSSSNPLRALAYADSVDDSGTFVQATASTITDGTYVIWQQEQFVTVRTPDANYASDNSIKGDPNGDIAKLRNNVLDSVNATFPNQSSINTPADQLLNKSFILPQMMLVSKPTDGAASSDVSGIVVNGKTHAQWRNDFLGDPNLPGNFNTAAPTSVTSGNGSKYGVVTGTTSLAPGNSGDVAITAQDISGNSTGAAAAPKGNYLFGNFNQTGVRDYSAVMAGQVADAKLFAAGESILAGSGTNATNVNAATISNGTQTLHNNTKLSGLSSALSSMNAGNGATKGDLIVMGDYNGDGFFDGKDLYQMARGAAIADDNSSTILTATAANFGEKLRSGKLRKNAALDAMQAATAPLGTDDGLNAARAFQRKSASPSLTNDPTGANAFNKYDVNRDGLVNRIDASIVDHFIGSNYTNLNDQVNAAIATNGTLYDGRDANGFPLAETPKSISLVDVELNDTGGIGYNSDFAMIRGTVGAGLLGGDANFDGIVDISDLYTLAIHWKSSATRWSDADFNADGVVNAADLGQLSLNWQAGSGSLGPSLSLGSALSMLGLPSSVPEPGSIGLLMIGAGMLIRRRREG
jgi:hypothetical protein